MAGILDSKQRIFDTILTDEGRKQLADNAPGTVGLDIQFISFTDGETYYQADAVSGSDDAGSRLYLEAFSLPRDQITLETNANGTVRTPIGLIPDVNVIDGKIASIVDDVRTVVTSTTDFLSLTGSVVTSSAENFCKLQMIGTDDLFLDDDEFTVASEFVEFTLSDTAPIPPGEPQVMNINYVENVIFDKRLSSVPNFKFLPPVNKPRPGAPDGNKLGNFVNVGQEEILNYEQLLVDLEGREEKVIEFEQTSRDNNIHVQFFESKGNELRKLEIVDFGSFNVPGDPYPEKRVVFLGKKIKDRNGFDTFINIFTIVLE